MPLLAHLRELRKRVVLAVLGIVVGAVAGWFCFEPVFEALQRPLLDAAAVAGKDVRLNFTALAGALDMQIKVSLFLGVLLSSPWWLYQLWAFVTPGLTRKERRHAVGFLAAAVPLFAAGAYLAWLLLPRAVTLLTDFVPTGASNIVDAQTYLSFVMRLILAFGLAFVLPVLMVALSYLGLVRARTWLAGWRWAVFVIFLFAAVMTPTPDAFTMILVAIPMCVLYFAAVGVAALRDRRADRAQAERLAA
ncbi:twin-arginine translocase subunit TatC [Luteimicrobium subarcticum]|nr:twin-arginine translocase subunit TatC [Luteimicrobium subarcticum]